MKHLFVTAKIKANPGVDLAMLRKELDALVALSNTEDECIRFECREIVNEAGSFLLWEEFVSEAALDQHFKYPHTKNYLSKQLTHIEWQYFCE